MPSTKMRTFRSTSGSRELRRPCRRVRRSEPYASHSPTAMAGTAQTHKTPRRGIVKSANQAGFLLKGLTPSVDGSPNFLRRSESEPFPKSGRLIGVSSDISRTSPSVFRSAARRAFWILVENNTRSIGVLSNQASSVAPQTLQDARPVCGTKNFASVRLYPAPQLHWTIVAILGICASGTPKQVETRRHNQTDLLPAFGCEAP
jgi:hypothetical protein